MEGNIATLREVIPPLSIKFNGTNFESFPVAPGNPTLDGWYDVADRNGSVPKGHAWAFTTKLDVSGWGNQGLSFFPLQAGIQEGASYAYLTLDEVKVIDMISDCPLDIEQFIENNQGTAPHTLPALYQDMGPDDEATFPPLGWENVLYGRQRTFVAPTGRYYDTDTNTTITYNTLPGIMVLPIHELDFGSMDPTASDTLYFTRLVIPAITESLAAGVSAGFCYVPTVRMIIKGELKNESDLSYIFRLKDSFKTTQTDVGYGGL